MKPPDKRERDRLKTRTAILDATAAIMRDEGYAAVTSRRVAERAGLKSQLVHYHFASMDELFQELFERNKKEHFARHVSALTAPKPLEALWEINTDSTGMDLVAEFIAAANHRKVLREALVEARKTHRTLHAVVLEDYLSRNGIDAKGATGAALSFVLSSIAAMLVEERRLGISEGHDDVLAFVQALIASFTPDEAAGAPPGPPASKPAASKPAGPKPAGGARKAAKP